MLNLLIVVKLAGLLKQYLIHSTEMNMPPLTRGGLASSGTRSIATGSLLGKCQASYSYSMVEIANRLTPLPHSHPLDGLSSDVCTSLRQSRHYPGWEGHLPRKDRPLLDSLGAPSVCAYFLMSARTVQEVHPFVVPLSTRSDKHPHHTGILILSGASLKECVQFLRNDLRKCIHNREDAGTPPECMIGKQSRNKIKQPQDKLSSGWHIHPHSEKNNFEIGSLLILLTSPICRKNRKQLPEDERYARYASASNKSLTT